MVNWFQYNHCSKSIGLELIQLQQIWLESELLTTTHLHGWTRFLGLGGGLQVLVGSGKNERRHEVQIRSLSAWSVSEKTWDILGPFARIQQHFLKTEDMLPSCTNKSSMWSFYLFRGDGYPVETNWTLSIDMSDKVKLYQRAPSRISPPANC